MAVMNRAVVTTARVIVTVAAKVIEASVVARGSNKQHLPHRCRVRYQWWMRPSASCVKMKPVASKCCAKSRNVNCVSARSAKLLTKPVASVKLKPVWPSSSALLLRLRSLSLRPAVLVLAMRVAVVSRISVAMAMRVPTPLAVLPVR